MHRHRAGRRNKRDREPTALAWENPQPTGISSAGSWVDRLKQDHGAPVNTNPTSFTHTPTTTTTQLPPREVYQFSSQPTSSSSSWIAPETFNRQPTITPTAQTRRPPMGSATPPSITDRYADRPTPATVVRRAPLPTLEDIGQVPRQYAPYVRQPSPVPSASDPILGFAPEHETPLDPTKPILPTPGILDDPILSANPERAPQAGAILGLQPMQDTQHAPLPQQHQPAPPTPTPPHPQHANIPPTPTPVQPTPFQTEIPVPVLPQPTMADTTGQSAAHATATANVAAGLTKLEKLLQKVQTLQKQRTDSQNPVEPPAYTALVSTSTASPEKATGGVLQNFISDAKPSVDDHSPVKETTVDIAGAVARLKAIQSQVQPPQEENTSAVKGVFDILAAIKSNK